MKTFSQKANLDTESVRSTKLQEKNLLKSKTCSAQIHKNFAETFWTKNYLCFKVPSGQLKRSFEEPAAKFSPGVWKSLSQNGIENFRKIFSKNFSSELCSGHLDRNFDVHTEKKIVKSPIVVRADSGKRVK